jgi:hypothetical protein
MKTEQAGTLARVVSQSQYDGAHVFILGNPPDGFYAGPWRSLEYLNPTVKFHPSEDLPTVASEASLQTLWLVAVPERLIELERYQVQYAQNEVITPLQQCGNDVLYMLKIP